MREPDASLIFRHDTDGMWEELIKRFNMLQARM